MAKRNLFLIRHAQSESNAQSTKSWDCSTPDFKIPLTELGKTQARKLGAELSRDSDMRVAKNYVFSSPYVRALETSKYFMEGAGDVEFRGPTIICDLSERKIRHHDLLKKELEYVQSLPPDERFYYNSPHVESAAAAGNRMMLAIYDIRSWSRQPKHEDYDMNIYLFSHSWALEAYTYLEDINEINNNNLNVADKNFPLDMRDFGKKKRLKNCEYILKTYNS